MLTTSAVAIAARCCSGNGTEHPAASGSTSTSTTAPPTSAPVLTARDQNDGSTLTLVPGQRVVVTLASIFWQLQPLASNAVVGVAIPPATRAGVDCPHVPGSGCGTLSATYVAQHAGTVQLSAHRDVCGEALACAPAQKNWSLTIVVAER